MRRRAQKMIFTVVVVVALILGVPGAIAGSMMVWEQQNNSLQSRVHSMSRAIDRVIQADQEVTVAHVEVWARPFRDEQQDAYTRVFLPTGETLEVGTPPQGLKVMYVTGTSEGASVRMEVSAQRTILRIFAVLGAFAVGIGVSMLVGFGLAARMSRKISAPLIYLAAQAEQVGDGQVRARVKPSGIEEIDLVQEELVRTGERMAGRLAAERQFAADASHQLRTPLTALSMRLEEIEMMAQDEEIRNEAQQCLEQVERLTQVISDLLDPSARLSADTEAVDIIEVLNLAREEWEEAFIDAGRELVFTDQAAVPVLADAPKLVQVLATLIDNSLRYGSGTTRVVAKRSTSKRGVTVEVSDEGPGVPEEIAEQVFSYGVSSHGSSGIGLPLANDLLQGMGGRLELTQVSPPIFTVSLSSITASLTPAKVLPEGPLVSVGRRSRRF